MKVLILFAAAMQLLIAPALADGFYVYTMYLLSQEMWGFFHNEPTCDLVNQSQDIYKTKPDVSWKQGVSCDGEGCPFSKRNPEKIDRLEFHTRWGHYTYYKNREGKIVDTDDKVVGFCYPSAMKDTDFDCPMSWENSEHMLGAISLWCSTTIWK
ncbi:hypothetical protein B0T16DRAFT_388625 [Cercophora newfieldiana]|uniref:Uncharacterized protein n=1 Tax=Cercophora newfieldiana TaxID=92897 RepID=A0AA40CT42_9PEZI|nr:hypothetical protein B0T16DRAFT_388625 [Cercophora newfieldiana]